MLVKGCKENPAGVILNSVLINNSEHGVQGDNTVPIFVISVIIQVLLVLHVVKTGRGTMWIYVIVLLPLAGSIAYFIAEILPDLAGTRTGRQVQRDIASLINPNKDINRAAYDYSVRDTVENSIRLAEECIRKGMYNEAKDLYERCLTGTHESDPTLMYGLARCEYSLNNYDEVKSILDKLISLNPEYKNPDAHLLYAKTLDKLHQYDEALEEYKILDSYYPGPEPTYHYAVLLKKQGKTDLARELLEKIIHRSKISGRHYNSLHKTWIKLAKNEYNTSF